MKRLVSITLAALCITLFACASSGAQLARSSYGDDVDVAKMNAITDRALLDGHRIVWVNPPLKRPKPE